MVQMNTAREQPDDIVLSGTLLPGCRDDELMIVMTAMTVMSDE